MRRLKNLLPLACVALPLAFSSAARAWNATGHETVALIAYDQLSPAERSTLVGILEQHPRRDRDLLSNLQPGDDRATALFITAATWPDIVRSPVNPLNRSEHHPQWHYVDFPFELDGVKGAEPALQWDGKSDPANLIEAMQKVEPEFVAPHSTPARRAIDLCWIEHLVGDIHQPLHSISLYSKDFPTGDRGGNLIYFTGSDGQPDNLHWYWDSLEGRVLNLALIRPIASRVEQEHPLMSLQQPLTRMTVREWADESNEIAKADVYDNGQIPGISRERAHNNFSAVPRLPQAYQDKAHQVADLRVALAGYRLAATLKTLLGQMHESSATLPTAATAPMTP
jgi:hypothetical protein